MDEKENSPTNMTSRTTHRLQILSSTVLLREAPTLYLWLEITKGGSLWFRDWPELQHSNLKLLYFTARQNGPTRRTDESRCLRRSCIQFSESGLTAWLTVKGMRLIQKCFQVVNPSIYLIDCPVENLTFLLTHIRFCSLWYALAYTIDYGHEDRHL